MNKTGITFEGFDEMKMQIRMHIEGIEEMVMRALNAVMAEIVNWIKTNHSSLGGWQTRTGNLTNSIGYQHARITESGSILGVIFAGMSYAIYVEWKEGHWVLSGGFTEYRDKIMEMLARYVREQKD